MTKKKMNDAFFIGVDIGGTEVKIGLITDDGDIIKKTKESVSFDGYETPIIVTVNKVLGEFLKEAGVPSGKIKAIGVSATGAIDCINGVVAGSGGHIKNWLGTPIKRILEENHKIPTFVLNDANAAALGEMWKGAARGKKNVLVITIGTGVGGGIIVDGHILLGSHGFAGELGYLKPPFILNEPVVRRGCYEDYASMSALVRMVKDAASKEIIDSKYGIETNGKMIFEGIKNGDEKLREISERWIDNIAAGMVSLVHIFNPQIILIGGGVSSQKELFIDKLEKSIMNNIMDEFRIDLKIQPASLKNDAGMIGAVKFCIDSL